LVGASRWSDLSRRVLSGLVLLAVALLCVWAGGFAFLLLVAAGSFILGGEWVMMCGYRLPDWPMFWLPAIIALAALCTGFNQPWAGLLLVVVGTVTATLWTTRPARRRFELAFGLPYIGLSAVALPWLRADPEAGLRNTLFVLSIVWASDIGAYLVGRLVGGPKLAPAISPGKTWSGAAGGLISAMLAGIAVAACVSPAVPAFHAPAFHAPAFHAIGPAVVLGVISQSGDLLESALKRHFGVKDSGRIIPGHGGLLDRLDALLAVAPVAALLALNVGRGVVLWQ
jgi:phosphatidate cytidylyltransferase